MLDWWTSSTASGRIFKVSGGAMVASMLIFAVVRLAFTYPDLSLSGPNPSSAWFTVLFLIIVVIGIVLPGIAMFATGAYWILLIRETKSQPVPVRFAMTIAKLAVGAIYGFYLLIVAIIIGEVVDGPDDDSSTFYIILVLVCALAKAGEQRLTQWVNHQEAKHRRQHTRRFRRIRLRS